MSTAVVPRPPLIATKRAFTIVASKFNAEYVQGLVNHTQDELRSLAPAAEVTLLQVPGAFEIPVIVREVAARGGVDAVIAIGLILKGRTTHAEHLSHSVTTALQRIAIEYGVPVIHAVLSVENEEQARERCLGKQINRGIEAARAAVEISAVMSELRGT